MNMDYTDRTKLTGLDTAAMLEAMLPVERAHVLQMAPVIQEVIATLNLKDRPTMSTIAMANLSEYIRARYFDTLACLYREEFVIALADYFRDAGLKALTRKIMESMYKIYDTVKPEQLTQFQDGNEVERRKEPLFDFNCTPEAA